MSKTIDTKDCIEYNSLSIVKVIAPGIIDRQSINYIIHLSGITNVS
ncbi:MAG: hypothetical protein ACTS85_02405 [Arsenophonus sp. NC-PG7-MAG3]